MDKLPDYIYEMRSITRFGMNYSTHSQKRSDDFVNSFYDLVVGWDQITMTSVAKDGKRNQFYGLSVSMYGSTYPDENQRPTGQEQAPEGFVKGQSNGSPATPMEKIYVLKITTPRDGRLNQNNIMNINILKLNWGGVKSYLPYDEKKNVTQGEDSRGIRGTVSSG